MRIEAVRERWTAQVGCSLPTAPAAPRSNRPLFSADACRTRCPTLPNVVPAETETRGVARYRELFANPYAGALLGWSIVARLPNGMAALALVLLVRATGAGYGEAGLVAAAYGVAVAVGAPYGGRQVDRRGAYRVLRVRMVLYSGLLAGVAVLGELGAPIAVIALAAAATGLTMAPVSSVLRSIWPTVAGEDGAKTAYALDAALQEVIFVGGPLLVALLATIDPAAAVAGAAALAFVGTFAYARLPPILAAGPADERHRSRLGALSSVGVRTLALLSLCLGLGFGSAEIAVPAFAELQGNRALAGRGTRRILARVARRRPRRGSTAIPRRATKDHARLVRARGPDAPSAPGGIHGHDDAPPLLRGTPDRPGRRRHLRADRPGGGRGIGRRGVLVVRDVRLDRDRRRECCGRLAHRCVRLACGRPARRRLPRLPALR